MVAILVPGSRASAQNSIETLFIVDESRSMMGEHDFLKNFVSKFSRNLQGRFNFPGKFGLVGYGGIYADKENGAPRLIFKLGSANDFAAAVGTLITEGNKEDGYWAIDYGLKEIGFTSGDSTRRLIVLITDEDRFPIKESITQSSIDKALKNNGVILNGILNALEMTKYEPLITIGCFADLNKLRGDENAVDGFAKDLAECLGVLIGPSSGQKKAVEKESQLSTAKESTSYFTRTVVNRIRALRPIGGASFSLPKQTASAARTGATGLNAGDETLPDYPANLSVDVGHSRTRFANRYDTRSTHTLGTTDRLVGPQRLVGYGVGFEQARESLFGGSVKRSRGLTATAYLAEILDDNFTLVPQAALTVLSRQHTSPDGRDRDSVAGRGMVSLTLMGQTAMESVELSGFGQLAYTHDASLGSGGERAYLGQAVVGGEIALASAGTVQPFVGASADYDALRSKSTADHLGWQASAGLRSTLDSGIVLSATVSTARKGDERTTSGNIFVKFLF